MDISGELLRRFYRGRWFMLFASFLVMSSAGATYVFAIYSKDIKSTFGYNQKTLNTIGFFKDLGANAGIISGLISEVFPGAPALVLALGAAMNLSGYLLIYLSLTRRLPSPHLWQLCIYIFVGANSQGFANTGTLVPAVNNFPQSRGIVLGLLKGFVGLSTGIFTQLYHAFYGDDSTSLVLLISWLPAAISLLSIHSIRFLPLPRGPTNDFRVFLRFLYITIVIAVYLLVVIIIQKTSSFSRQAYIASAAVIIALVLSPLAVVFQEERRILKQHSVEHPTGITIDDQKRHSVEHPTGITIDDQKRHSVEHPTGITIDDQKRHSVEHPTGITTDSQLSPSQKHQEQQQQVENKKSTSCFANILRPPARGEDYTIPQALCSVDMAIIFVATAIGTGSTLTATDNMGQIGESLGYNHLSIGTFISLISIWSYAGRVIAGFLSEVLIHKYKCPRPLIMAIVIFISCIGHILIAFPTTGSIYIATIVLGFTFGAQMPLFLAMISELFGLKHYSTLFNVGVLSSPVGSYVFNVQVAGKLYDREAARQMARMAAPPPEGREKTCMGVECYRMSFIIITAAAFFASVLMVVLTFRTKEFYRSDIYAKYKEAEKSPEEGEKTPASGCAAGEEERKGETEVPSDAIRTSRKSP